MNGDRTRGWLSKFSLCWDLGKSFSVFLAPCGYWDAVELEDDFVLNKR